MRATVVSFLFALVMATPEVLSAQSVTLTPDRDNTLYEDTAGALSNGSGDYLFTGRTQQGRIRRALLRFDVAGHVPAGARVDSVVLRLNVSREMIGAHPASLHRVLRAWGEGSSNANNQEGSGAAAAGGDATWVHAFFDTLAWQTPGGDFEPQPSATVEIEGTGSYEWGSTPAMVADVQAWLDDPASNFGWIVIGNEQAAGTAKRFDSREHADEAVRPALVVYYSGSVANEPEPEVPRSARLLSNYPNPFSSATMLSYVLSAPQRVRLEVFDVLGRSFGVLVDGWQPAGTHHARFDGAGLPPGLYLYRLQAGRDTAHGRMVLQR